MVPLHRASIIVVPDSGVKEANTPELKALIEEVGDYQAVVSIVDHTVYRGR